MSATPLPSRERVMTLATLDRWTPNQRLDVYDVLLAVASGRLVDREAIDRKQIERIIAVAIANAIGAVLSRKPSEGQKASAGKLAQLPTTEILIALEDHAAALGDTDE